MSRPSRPWFRFYVESMNDRKLRRLTPAQRWLWVAILSAARQSTTPGVLLVAEGVPMTYAELADYAGMKPREIEPAVTEMMALGMVVLEGCGALCVKNWKERQFESDDVTARTAKHRSKERSQTVPGNAPETETEQNRTESEAKPYRRKAAREVPDDWTPSDDTREWALSNYPQHAKKGVLLAFISNSQAKGLKYRNIDQAFRNWIRREERFHPAQGRSETARTHL